MLRRSESFFSKKSIASSVGLTSGILTTSYTTGFLTATGFAPLTIPIGMGFLIGILPASIVSSHLDGVYDRLQLKSNFRAICAFTILATTHILGTLLSFAAISLLVGLTINPFTTPALIAGGVSAGLIVGLYVYADQRMRKLALYGGHNLHRTAQMMDLDGNGRVTYRSASVVNRQIGKLVVESEEETSEYVI